MTRTQRRLLKLAIWLAVLPALWGLILLYDKLMEPSLAERLAREFLQTRSLTLEQFTGPEFRPRTVAVHSYYVWKRPENDQLLELEVFPRGDLICLYHKASSGENRRTVCQYLDGDANQIIESEYPFR